MKFFKQWKPKTNNYGEKIANQILRLTFNRVTAVCLIAALLLILLMNCFTIIKSGYTGVKTTFGQIDSVVMGSGIHFKLPFVQGIKKVNNKQQEITFNEKIWGESSERTVVYMSDVTVTYRINPEHSTWLYRNVNDYKQNALPQSLVSSAMKSSMVTLPSTEVTNRSKIEPIAGQNLQMAINQKYDGRQVITIANIAIKDMNFEDSYNQAIANKQIAQMEYEQQQIQNQKSIDTAAANAEQKLIVAQADADKKVIEADAEAKSIKTVAEAQADANKKLASSVTDTLVEYEKVQKWDGELPTVSGGSSIISMDIDK